MKKYLIIFSVLALVACSSTDNDITYPIIDDDTFLPVDCAQIAPTGTLHVHFQCSDDVELGSYNIEIHSNFDHHTHGTSSVDCDADEHDHNHADEHEHMHDDDQLGWVYNQDFTIPAGQKTYAADIDIAVPADAPEGEYHFMLRLTDRAGWQALKSVPIHIVE